jgi:hypothetical protein
MFLTATVLIVSAVFFFYFQTGGLAKDGLKAVMGRLALRIRRDPHGPTGQMSGMRRTFTVLH